MKTRDARKNGQTALKKPKEYNCAVCPFSTKYGHNLQRHITTHLEEKRRANTHSVTTRPFLCPESGCNYAAKSKCNLIRHSKIHVDKESLFCSHPTCNYSTNDKGHLTLHIRIHTGEKPFVCQFESCSFAAAVKSSLVVHTRTHTKERPYKCPETNCQYSATQSGNLKSHQLTHSPKEGEERPLFKCPLCEFSTKYKCTLSDHIKTHTREKPFACSFESCGYRFRYKHHLSDHLKTHSEERQYKCELCPYRGKTRIAVRNHLQLIHIAPDFRPFKCTEPNCGYASKRKGDFQRHLSAHKAEKNYACSFPHCGYRATQKGNVNSHEYNVHSLEKREKCSLCDYRCKEKRGLVRHMRTHTK